MKKIKWGIIGCGDVTEVKSGPAFKKVNNSELVAVMRRDAAKAEDYARRHSVAKWYSDAQQLIDDPEVTAVYVATPPQSHEEYTIRALKAGKPVYVEKPMTVDSASAERMLQASLDTGVKLCVAHYRNAQPRFKKMKALINAGEIGAVRLVNLHLYEAPRTGSVKVGDLWRIDPGIAGGGMFHDLSPHQLNLVQYFFGDYEKASGFSLNQGKLYNADDIVVGTILFKNRVVFNGSWCFTPAKSEEKDLIEIIGTEGSIRFSIFSTHQFTLNKNGKEEVIKFDELEHVQQPMIELVVKYFLDEGPDPSPAESGVTTMQLIDIFTGKK
jgi:predicted dehydrogenase